MPGVGKDVPRQDDGVAAPRQRRVARRQGPVRPAIPVAVGRPPRVARLGLAERKPYVA